MSWIKLRTKLKDDGRVMIASRKCNVPSVTLVGALVTLWCYADDHADENGVLYGWTTDDVNQRVGVSGFAESLPTDWIDLTGEWVKLPKYQEHNGTTAKSRALNQQRVKAHRKQKTCNVPSVTECVQNSYQRREEKSTLLRNVYTHENCDPVVEQKPKTQKPTQSPIRTGCEYFRASDAEIESAEKIYIERGYDLAWLLPAQQVIDDWLADGATTNAIRARKQNSHYRRLWADWVIERAEKASRGFKREILNGLTSEEADKKVAEMNAQLAAKNLQKNGINIGALTKNVGNTLRGKSLDRERERRRSDLRNQILSESGSGFQGTIPKIS